MTRLTLVPEPFTLVKFDAARVRELVDECATAVGFPPKKSKKEGGHKCSYN
jgi:hypothetical protein